MHLLVLSAFRPPKTHKTTGRGTTPCLNAPSGAQCFPTSPAPTTGPQPTTSQCTFWCSVLSDRLVMPTKYNLVVPSQCTFWCSALSDYQGHEFARREDASQCTFWCSVLSDSTLEEHAIRYAKSQCTFWCSVLSDRNETRGVRKLDPVSMHLLVLSAFRLVSNHQRFVEVTVSMHLLVLSAFRLSRTRVCET